jgi:hypothetical protein
MSVVKRYTDDEVLEFVKELTDREGISVVAKKYGLWPNQLCNFRAGDKKIGPAIAKRFGFIVEDRLYRKEG